MGRAAYTMELDPKYCDVIVRRFREAVGVAADVFLVRDSATIPYDTTVDL
jgi:hypothetical protein